ncbi:LytTR family DNA-binding domain-containing protein [Alteromonas sp. KUL49]|uniref:LytR/AlgR family response regulator transcription factor n=1 Tax=Alteromonas sp. KUL49 TaxID=2480798 RepID=UPI00102EE9BC|nr:LytTR family DNA-binding domain-containing protein [Alteromonas sp. KUL49]TAP40831.1 response regulator transcription factor [Alteromonas sp. KUL49]GEA11009.1 DNA-binding response regulator [Alteromonas sp. KUL49]
MLNVLIADDERLSRETMKMLLSQRTDIDRVYEASDGKEAMELAQIYEPELVLLDVEMPRMNGMEVAQTLPSKSNVVFVTAYNEHAANAFELDAVDYVLKPYDDDRFNKAIARAYSRIHEESPQDVVQIGEMLKQIINQENTYRDRLVIRDPGRIRLVDVNDIVYISGAGNYAEIHLKDGKQVLHRETLTVLEGQLNPDIFVRIHRSTIVKRSAISELRPNEKGDYSVILNTGDVLMLSRRNRTKLAELTS